MAVAVYDYTMGGAPTLNGTPGTLISVLDYCLLPSGWTKPYSGANKAVYRSPAGNQFYLRVDDSGLDAPIGGSARVTAYESMTTVDVGTNPFPAAGQGSSGAGYVFWHKNVTAGGTGGAWRLIVTDKFVWFWARTQTNFTAGTGFVVCGFGDFPSKKTGDTFNTVLIGNVAASFNGNYLSAGMQGEIATAGPVATGAIFVARQQDQTGISQPIRFVPFESDKMGGSGAADGTLSNATSFTCPHIPDGKIFISTIEIAEKPGANCYWRGTLPGIYSLAGMGDAFFTDDLQISVGGKTLLAARAATSATSTYGWVLFEVSNTW